MYIARKNQEINNWEDVKKWLDMAEISFTTAERLKADGWEVLSDIREISKEEYEKAVFDMREDGCFAYAYDSESESWGMTVLNTEKVYLDKNFNLYIKKSYPGEYDECGDLKADEHFYAPALTKYEVIALIALIKHSFKFCRDDAESFEDLLRINCEIEQDEE